MKVEAVVVSPDHSVFLQKWLQTLKTVDMERRFFSCTVLLPDCKPSFSDSKTG